MTTFYIKDVRFMKDEIEILNFQNETSNEDIKKMIYTIREKQVMIDSDVANLYHYKTKALNLAVKRNIERFPEDFCFKLTREEFENLRFQFETLNLKVNNGSITRKYLPYAFTEQGIAMLAEILKSDIAVNTSIKIIQAFISMRKILIQNGQVFERLSILEYKQLQNEKNFKQLFDMFKQEEVKQKIFFEGQIWDSYSLIIDIIKKANTNIVIIDNYIDDSILDMLTKRRKGVESVIITSEKSNISHVDIQKFNKEYPILKVVKSNKFHDRFIVIDNIELYHLLSINKGFRKEMFCNQ